MKKYIFLFFIVLIILSGCFFQTLSQFSEDDIIGKKNKIPNSGFEDGIFGYEKTPDKWLIVNKPENLIFWENGIHHNGEKCLKIKNPNQKINIFSDAINIYPEDIYYTRCFVRADKSSNASITLLFLAFNITGKRVNRFVKKIKPGEEWSQIELVTGYFKNSALFGRVVISIPKKSGITFWIDDVESYKVYKFRKRWEEE